MGNQLKNIWIKLMKGGPMVPAEEAIFNKGNGIAGNANLGGRRQVTIIEEELWEEMMNELGASLDPMNRRANLLINGVSLKESRGKILHIGENSIEICGETKPCWQMDEVLPGLKDTMFPEWRGGAFGKVLTNGKIRRGDPIELVDKNDNVGG
ncbi:MOSC domain-containing protein [Salicibibacter cibi]|uniref:MOSC domain-containing protein n=1 Tax=Salicibibacter cibi TaxID=2743001 RepID=A0A7T7CEF1_9BACI|nr:MOSC domain-containing protein [Salicibibacter cibi]QQK78974.1 MOSC domain-containing protein [Salicibibacter cibi]